VQDGRERIDGYRVGGIHGIQDIARKDPVGHLEYSTEEDNARRSDGSGHTPRSLRLMMVKVHRERAGTGKCGVTIG
jgi:hypothetical protein